MPVRVIILLFLLGSRLVNCSIAVAETVTLKGHTDTVTSVAFSPNGLHVVSASVDSTLRLWDATTGEGIATLEGHTAGVNGAAFSPDGKWIASASEDTTAKLWNAATCAESLTLKGHIAAVNCVVFSPDGTWIVTGSDDRTVKIWNVATGVETRSLVGHTSAIASLAVSPDGKQIASGSDDGSVKIWNAVDGANIFGLKGSHGGPVSSIMFQCNGKQIISTSTGPDARIHKWDTISGEQIGEVQKDANGASLSADGRRLAIATRHKRIKLLDAHSTEFRRVLRGHTGNVTSVAFGPDGCLLASGSDDHTVKLWDVSVGIYETRRAEQEEARKKALAEEEAAAANRRENSPWGRASARYQRGLRNYRLGIAISALGIFFIGYAVIFRKTVEPTSPALQWIGITIVTAVAGGLLCYAWIWF